MDDSRFRLFSIAFGALVLVAIGLATFYVAERAAATCPGYQEKQLNFREKGDWDLHERLDLPEHNVLLIRTALSERCYVVPKSKLADPVLPDHGHPLGVIREPLSTAMLEHIGGQEAVDFCANFPAYQATNANSRQRRQAASPTGAAAAAPTGATTAAAAPAAAASSAGGRPLRVTNNLPNDCQDNTLIFCPDTVQETCTSGPGSLESGGLYKLTIKCVEPTKINAQVVTRCSENPDTKGMSAAKCMEKFAERASAALRKLNAERAAQQEG